MWTLADVQRSRRKYRRVTAEMRAAFAELKVEKWLPDVFGSNRHLEEWNPAVHNALYRTLTPTGAMIAATHYGYFPDPLTGTIQDRVREFVPLEDGRALVLIPSKESPTKKSLAWFIPQECVMSSDEFLCAAFFAWHARRAAEKALQAEIKRSQGKIALLKRKPDPLTRLRRKTNGFITAVESRQLPGCRPEVRICCVCGHPNCWKDEKWISLYNFRATSSCGASRGRGKPDPIPEIAQSLIDAQQADEELAAFQEERAREIFDDSDVPPEKDDQAIVP